MRLERASQTTTRRRFLTLTTVIGGAVLAASCGAAPASPTPAPKVAEATKPAAPAATAASGAAPTTAPAAPAAATTAPAAATAPVAAAKPGASLKPVARNRTLALMFGGVEGIYRDHEIWNPYAIGASHQVGGMLMYEPLAFYSAFADKTIYWLAESHQFSPDYKQLDIKLRNGITWSDGKPFSADDVAYTLNALNELGPKVRWGVEIQQFVKEAKATAADKVTVTFKVPSPKFFFFMSYKYDIGVYPVPKHIFEKEDWTKYLAYDPAQGLPVTTGPWQVMAAFQDQKVLDRRDGWWAARAGLTELPKVERIIYLPFTGETQAAQAIITNQIDSSLDLRPNTIKTVLLQNPKVTSHVGNQPPYGYVDWWPTGLYFNCEREPFSNPDVRWAISSFIDRKQVVEVGYGGAATPSLLPMPSYPALKPFVDSIRDLLERYPTNAFDPAKGSELLTKAGYKKGADGIWAKDGKQLSVEILGRALFADIGPVVNEQLRRQGLVSSYIQPPDALDRFRKADYQTAFNGHGGSVSGDPYYTLRLYQSTTAGGTVNTTQSNFTRWSNPEFDKIVDEMAIVAPDDQKKLIELYRKAMELWLPGLPDAQITEWYHRIPMNTTYWTGWPTKDDAYVNGAFWALTNQLVLNRLKPAQ